jgi:hypothetical protein
MKTSEAHFEAKVELIPTAKLFGNSGLYSPLLATDIMITFNNTSLLSCEEVVFKNDFNPIIISNIKK